MSYVPKGPGELHSTPTGVRYVGSVLHPQFSLFVPVVDSVLTGEVLLCVG